MFRFARLDHGQSTGLDQRVYDVERGRIPPEDDDPRRQRYGVVVDVVVDVVVGVAVVVGTVVGVVEGVIVAGFVVGVGMVVVVVGVGFGANGLRSLMAPWFGTKSKQVLRHRLPTNSVWTAHRYLRRLGGMRSLVSGIRTLKLLRDAFHALTENRRRSPLRLRSLNISPTSRDPVERTSA
jgi:hypothetical protein